MVDISGILLSKDEVDGLLELSSVPEGDILGTLLSTDEVNGFVTDLVTGRSLLLQISSVSEVDIWERDEML